MKSFLMPDGKRIEVATVADLERVYPLSFAQYQGFVARFPDPVLAELTLMIEDHSAKIGHGVLDEAAISDLAHAPVIELQFGKIPDTTMSFAQLVEHMRARYPSTEQQEVATRESFVEREVALVDPRSGAPVCHVRYVPMGVPGSFVVLLPQP